VGNHSDSPADAYEAFYRQFDSPLMRAIRKEAYGEDIGQNSWVSAAELREDVRRLRLTRSSRLLDVGCGPCGPLTFLMAAVGCTGTGMEISPAALEVGRERARSLGVEASFSAQVADLDEPLALEAGAFDAAMAIDVLLHVRDRLQLYTGIARVLRAGGRCLFTDAGVITGPVTNEEIRNRSPYGYTQFVIAGWNERLIEAAGFRILETEDRTASVLRNAGGRLSAMLSHRQELEALSGATWFDTQRRYLETVVELARKRAISRIMYLTEVQAHA
jgi:cyclopropane fatty-acyl-phospholipid synthase-like methyltransferase